MKTRILLLVALVAIAVPLGAPAQGKISFQNDTKHLVYYDPSVGNGLGGTPVGASAPGGSPLVADLYVGVSSSTLYLYSTATFNSQLPGRLNNLSVQLVTNAVTGAPTISGGMTGWVQVIVRESSITPPNTWTPSSVPSSVWFGASAMFRFAFGFGATYPAMYTTNASPPWAGGSFNLDSYGLGWRGAIAVGVDASSFPRIGTGPLPTATPEGGDATFTVSATGDPVLRYQWRKAGAAISGATDSSFTITGATTNDSGQYSVSVSNAYGSVTSTSATLTVYISVGIVAQPVSAAVAGGTPATFTVSASGVPAPAYQWYFQGSALANATSNTLVVSPVIESKLGAYYARAYNSYSSATSDIVTLNMSPTIFDPFAGAVLVWGKPGTLSVSATGSGTLGYQWFFNGAAIDGATSSTFDFESVQLTNGGIYSVVISSQYGSVTNSAQVVVNPANTSIGLYPGVTIEGVIGYSYGIEYTTNLGDLNAWTPYTNVVLTQPTQTWVDSVEVHSGPARSYRVTAQ
jgi:hypothetical protein